MLESRAVISRAPVPFAPNSLMPNLPDAETLAEQSALLQQNRFLRYLIGGATLVIILLGVRAIGDLISPILIAFLLALGLSPLLVALQRRGVPTPIALFLVVGLLIAIGLVLVFIITSSISQLVTNLPSYFARFETRTLTTSSTLEQYGIHVQGLYPANFVAIIPPATLQAQLLALSSGLLVTIGEVFLVFLLFIFLLLDLVNLPKRIAGGLQVNPEMLARVSQVRDSIINYFVLRTRVNLLAGIMNGGICFVFGIDFAVLWALFAFLAGYIPSFGYTVAALPPIFFAWLQFGFPAAILPSVILLGAMILTDQVISPRLTAKGMNLPVSVLLLSLLIWGWLLGLLGALVAGPLTIVLKLTLSGFPETQWLANLMSGQAEPEVAEKIAPRLPKFISSFFVAPAEAKPAPSDSSPKTGT